MFTIFHIKVKPANIFQISNNHQRKNLFNQFIKNLIKIFMIFVLKKNKKIKDNSRKIKFNFRKSKRKEKIRLQIMTFLKISK
jgi:hypothetical protein